MNRLIRRLATWDSGIRNGGGSEGHQSPFRNLQQMANTWKHFNKDVAS